jgi:DNA-directed RNA polymerase sigma subunit (sigma70/sigma32)
VAIERTLKKDITRKGIDINLYSDIVIKKMGLNMDEAMTLREISKELSLSHQKDGQIYHRTICILEKNQAFKRMLRS